LRRLRKLACAGIHVFRAASKTWMAGTRPAGTARAFVSDGGLLGVTLWPETPLGGTLTSGPAAVARRGAGNWIDMVVRGTDNAYWHSVVFSHTHA